MIFSVLVALYLPIMVILLFQLHGKTYFRLEHYLPASVLDKLNQSTIKEELSKLHSNYYEASDTEAEFEFLKVFLSFFFLLGQNIILLCNNQLIIRPALILCKEVFKILCLLHRF